MAKIPTYQASKGLQGNVNLGRFQPDQSGQKLKEIGQKINALGVKIEEVKNEKEQLNAENKLNEKLNDIRLRQSKDQDTSSENQAKYSQEINNAISDASSMINNKTTRENFISKAESTKNIINFELQKSTLAKEISQFKVQSKIREDNFLDEYALADGDGKRAVVIQNYFSDIDRWRSKDLMSDADVQNAKISAVKNSEKRRVERDLAVNPEQAIFNIDNNVYNIEDEDKIKYKKDAYTQIKNNKSYLENRIKTEQENNSEKLMSELAINPLKYTPSDIRNMISNGMDGITKTKANSIISYLKKDPSFVKNSSSLIQNARRMLYEQFETKITNAGQVQLKSIKDFPGIGIPGYLDVSQSKRINDVNNIIGEFDKLLADGFITASKYISETQAARNILNETIDKKLIDFNARAFREINNWALTYDPINSNQIGYDMFDSFLEDTKGKVQDEKSYLQTIDKLKRNIATRDGRSDIFSNIDNKEPVKNEELSDAVMRMMNKYATNN